MRTEYSTLQPNKHAMIEQVMMIVFVSAAQDCNQINVKVRLELGN